MMIQLKQFISIILTSMSFHYDLSAAMSVGQDESLILLHPAITITFSHCSEQAIVPRVRMFLNPIGTSGRGVPLNPGKLLHQLMGIIEKNATADPSDRKSDKTPNRFYLCGDAIASLLEAAGLFENHTLIFPYGEASIYMAHHAPSVILGHRSESRSKLPADNRYSLRWDRIYYSKSRYVNREATYRRVFSSVKTGHKTVVFNDGSNGGETYDKKFRDRVRMIQSQLIDGDRIIFINSEDASLAAEYLVDQCGFHIVPWLNPSLAARLQVAVGTTREQVYYLTPHQDKGFNIRPPTQMLVLQKGKPLNGHTSISKFQTPARSSRLVATWKDYFTETIRGATSAESAWAQLIPSLGYLIGLHCSGFWCGPEKDFWHLGYPLSIKDLEEIGAHLQELWKPWNQIWGRITQGISSLGMVPFYSSERFEQCANRILALSQGKNGDRLSVLFTIGIVQPLHLRYYWLHPEVDSKGQLIAYDNELLKRIVREMIPRYLAWRDTEESLRHPPLRDSGVKLGVLCTQRDLMLWGITAMLDPFIHAFVHADSDIFENVQALFPKGAQQSVTRFMLGTSRDPGMLRKLREVDVDGRPTGQWIAQDTIESLLVEMLSRKGSDWEHLGLHPPMEIFQMPLPGKFSEFQRQIFPDSWLSQNLPSMFVDPYFRIAELNYKLTSMGYDFSEWARHVMCRDPRLYLNNTTYSFDNAGFQHEVFTGWFPFQKAFPELLNRLKSAS